MDLFRLGVRVRVGFRAMVRVKVRVLGFELGVRLVCLV